MSKQPTPWSPFGGKKIDEAQVKRWKDHEEQVGPKDPNFGKRTPNPKGAREDDRAKKRRRGF